MTDSTALGFARTASQLSVRSRANCIITPYPLPQPTSTSHNPSLEGHSWFIRTTTKPNREAPIRTGQRGCETRKLSSTDARARGWLPCTWRVSVGGRRQRPAAGCGCGDARELRGTARGLGRRRCKSSARPRSRPRPRRRRAAAPSPFLRELFGYFAVLFHHPRRGFCTSVAFAKSQWAVSLQSARTPHMDHLADGPWCLLPSKARVHLRRPLGHLGLI